MFHILTMRACLSGTFAEAKIEVLFDIINAFFQISYGITTRSGLQENLGSILFCMGVQMSHELIKVFFYETTQINIEPKILTGIATPSVFLHTKALLDDSNKAFAYKNFFKLTFQSSCTTHNFRKLFRNRFLTCLIIVDT
jgi:hypothetical protein